MKEKKIKYIREIIGIILLILFGIGLIKMIPTFASLITEEGRIEFEAKIESFGLKGALFIIALQICKIVLVFLPGEPIELLTGMCYGPWLGLIIIYIGTIISNAIIICLVKKYGITFVRDVVKDDKIEKVKEMIDNNPDRTEFTLFVLYFLPILPKDFITYVASLLPISPKRFLMISIIGRFPAVFSSVLVGSKILDGKIISIVFIYLITYVISGIIAMVYKRT